MLHTPLHFRSNLPCNIFVHANTLASPLSPSSSFRQPSTVRTHLRTNGQPWVGQLPEPTTTPAAGEGPILLPPSSLLGNLDDPSPLQLSTSVLLTAAISVFLFRSLRRRATRAKQMRVRSTGVKKGLKEEALDSLRAMQSASVEPGSPPSPVQALLGGLSAAVIAIVLYKFTTTIEAALNRQSISDNFSVRQITITIRTIINGICYLATFVFGINSIGLILYSGQLAINSFMEKSPSNGKAVKDDGNPSMMESDSNDQNQSSE
ncbi:uncharacterized protein LOC143861006 [Tasmannia lanceolata]|uniref:uncharacterized protein LOC143861006 n=1 Tax=Tasmannia lanceolata TaxID=3420 RepID=UPI0040629584